MKKFLSIILSISMLIVIGTPTYAAEISTQYDVSGITGTIIFQEEGPTGPQTSRNNDIAVVTVSYVHNSDGSYTIFQYNDGEIIEEHAVMPGSGAVDHKFYGADGSVTEEREVVQKNPDTGIEPIVNNDPYSNLASGASKKEMGYMLYTHLMTNEQFSIRGYLLTETHLGQSYTFYKGAAKTLANWISILLSLWAFYVSGPELVQKALGFCGVWGIFSAVTTGLMTALVTKKVTCTYYNQELHGTPIKPSGRGRHGRLDGTYAYVTSDGKTEFMKEGYTQHDWGKVSMGRMMMYKVFDLDEIPDHWVNAQN